MKPFTCRIVLPSRSQKFKKKKKSIVLHVPNKNKHQLKYHRTSHHRSTANSTARNRHKRQKRPAAPQTSMEKDQQQPQEEVIRHRTVEAVNGIAMHVAESGPEDGGGEGKKPAVLFLHGFPELWYSWRHQMSFLAARGYRCVAPDLRGYGGTEAPQDVGDYSAFHLIGDVVALLDALRLPKVSYSRKRQAIVSSSMPLSLSRFACDRVFFFFLTKSRVIEFTWGTARVCVAIPIH